jgi:catechol 2,3-dioxygenase
MASKLNELTSLGPVTLQVADLQAQIDFYRSRLGLSLLSNDSQVASLGTPLHELVHLKLHPGAKRYAHVAGLYHFCLRVEKRVELGLLLGHLLKTGTPLDGLVDHRMAEAVYLKDAEGNGIELNWDRPRDQWRPWAEWLSMGNAPLDSEGLLSQAGKSGRTFEGIEAQARIGHIHLHVGDLEAAEKFYVEVVGFERTATVPGQAVFTSAGGYHHHVAFNLWAGKNAAIPPADAQGLMEFTVLVEGEEELGALRLRAEAAHLPVESSGADLVLADPWKHSIRFKKN